MLRAKEVIDGRQRFQLSHHARQGRSVVMDFRFLHPPLAVLQVEELEHAVRSAAAEYDRLVHQAGEIDRLKAEIDKLHARVAALEAEVARLHGCG